MSRTKVKQNLIDASFGNILEQIVYRADGRTITTSQGNITVPNITAGTSVSSTTFIDFPGSNIDYQPPTGTTLVACEIKFYAGMADHSGHVDNYKAPTVVFNVDGTDVTSSKRTWLQQNAWDVDYANYLFMRITGGSDNIAAEEIGTWTTAKTIKLRACAYSASYGYKANVAYHYQGSGATNTVIPPVIKITAYS